MRPSSPAISPTPEPTKGRHRPELGYARGDETRRRIIDAAIQLFGQRSYDGASTRDIAKLAGVNAPALQYYFNGKEGLYRACAEHILETTAVHFQPALAHAQDVLAAPSDREDLIAAFNGIQDALADHLLASKDAQDRRLFVTHEHAGRGPNLLMDIMESSLRPRIDLISAELVGRLTDAPASDRLTRVRAMTLHGQLMIFYMAPRKMQDVLGSDVDGDRARYVKDVVRQQTRILIDSWKP